MKKILTAVLLIATLVSASAQTQKRPYLLMTEARTEAAKQRLKNDQMLNDAWKNIREFADKNIKSNDINKLEHLSYPQILPAVGGDNKAVLHVPKLSFAKLFRVLPDSVDLLFLQHILIQQKFILFAINIITT